MAEKNSKLSNLLLAGSCACFADAATFPADTVKVRVQMSASESTMSVIRRLVATDGASGLYAGISAGLQRQFAFASIRIGLYEPLKEMFASRLDSESWTMRVRLLSGASAGAIAVCIAQPTDVAKVRMQCSGATGCLSTYSNIVRADGVCGLWRGVCPNIARNSIVNCAEVVTYDTVKTNLVKAFHLSDSPTTHCGSALVSGLVATLVASPVDVIKTRMMGGGGAAGGLLKVTSDLLKDGGLRALYKGFVPSFVRIGGWNVVMFVTYEQAKLGLSGARQSLAKFSNLRSMAARHNEIEETPF